MKNIFVFFMFCFLMFSCQSDGSTVQQEENQESSQLTPEPEPEERDLVWSDEFEGTS